MTHERIISTHHFVQPGDSDKTQQISFDLAELKTLQSIMIERIKQDAKENCAYLSHRELVEKLEYFITDLEG